MKVRKSIIAKTGKTDYIRESDEDNESFEEFLKKHGHIEILNSRKKERFFSDVKKDGTIDPNDLPEEIRKKFEKEEEQESI